MVSPDCRAINKPPVEAAHSRIASVKVTYPIFHLAFPVRDLTKAKNFYITALGARTGRIREKWIDIYLFGGQITLHEQPDQVLTPEQQGARHFGAVLAWQEWEILAKRLEEIEIKFKVNPNISYKGSATEQAKLLVTDPSGNVIEIKAYRNPSVALEMADLKICSSILG